MAKYIDKEIDYDYVWTLKQQINNEKTTTYITLLSYDWVWATN